METIAVPRYSGPDEASATPQLVSSDADPRATITSLSPGSARLPLPVLNCYRYLVYFFHRAHVLTKDPGTGQTPESQAVTTTFLGS